MSENGDVGAPPSRLDDDEAAKKDEFPKKPKAPYVLKVAYATERVIAWEAIQAFHGEKNGNVKQRDRDNAIGTRNAVLHNCEVDRAVGSIQFAPGWMAFQSAEQIDHLRKCFKWQLSDEGPGIELEKMVIADDIIKGLDILSAKAEADRETAEKPKAKRKARSASKS